jgi:hypothetical protein
MPRRTAAAKPRSCSARWATRSPTNGGSERNVRDPGIAVAPRHPIVDRRLIELPHHGAALAARIRAPEGTFWFCSAAPSSWLPDQEGQREDDVIALDAALAEIAEGDELPPILASDFNATPDSASIRFLCGLQSLHGHSTAAARPKAARWPPASSSSASVGWCPRCFRRANVSSGRPVR